jgi:hypothetical protein
MRVQLMTVTMLLVLVLSANASAAMPKKAPVRIAGTYTDLQYNAEGGDLLGMEIKIVPVVGDRMQAVVLVSEGEPAPLVIVDVHVKDHAISFAVPENVDQAWSFNGTVTATSLTGTITYASGIRRKVTLPRRCGYWDRS